MPPSPIPSDQIFDRMSFHYQNFNLHIVVATSGYVCLSTALQRIKVAIQGQNSVPGIAIPISINSFVHSIQQLSASQERRSALCVGTL